MCEAKLQVHSPRDLGLGGSFPNVLNTGFCLRLLWAHSEGSGPLTIALALLYVSDRNSVTRIRNDLVLLP